MGLSVETRKELHMGKLQPCPQTLDLSKIDKRSILSRPWKVFVVYVQLHEASKLTTQP